MNGDMIFLKSFYQNNCFLRSKIRILQSYIVLWIQIIDAICINLQLLIQFPDFSLELWDFQGQMVTFWRDAIGTLFARWWGQGNFYDPVGEFIPFLDQSFQMPHQK